MILSVIIYSICVIRVLQLSSPLFFIMALASRKNVYVGIGLAVLAVIIWSGNFIVARGVIKQIQPVSLAFYRWLIASLLIMPFAIRSFKAEWAATRQSWPYLFWVSLTGIALFNTCVYIGAHYTTAINLALIGTTSSPVFAIVLARIFLKEKIGWLKMIGLALCISGVVFLLAKGHLQNLLTFRFTAGDGWILLAAFFFAVYNTLVRKKPAGISSINYLFITFSLGTLLLFPFYLWETSTYFAGAMEHKPSIDNFIPGIGRFRHFLFMLEHCYWKIRRRQNSFIWQSYSCIQ